MAESSRRGDDYLSSADAEAAAQLEAAVHSGNTQAVRDIIDQSQPIPKWLTAATGYQLLCRAVMHRDPTMVSLLLQLRPALELESKSKRQTSPLWTSLIFSQVEITRLIINAGADVNKRMGPNSVHDPECSVLHYMIFMCSYPEREQLIGLMIDRGADVNAVDLRGETPLHHAAILNDIWVAEMLLSKGANVNARDVRGETPLLAASKGFAKEKMMNLLLRNEADVLAHTNEGCNVLHLLANSGSDYPKVAEIFLKHKVPLHEVDSAKQYTPLQYAITQGKEEVTKMFIEHGADVDGWKGCPMAPLLLAAAQKSAFIIEFLIIKGADMECKTKRGKTALHIACKNLQDKCISILLEYGADINALDDDGATPFSLIEFKNLGRAVNVMIRAIAKRTALNKPTNKMDMGIIKEYPLLERFYNDCLKELEKMKELRLFTDVPYFSLFSKTLYKLALLLRNDRFEFPLRLRNINKLFPIYSKDFERALRRAELLNADLCRIENNLTYIFSEELPYPVIREIMKAVLPTYVHV